MLLQIQHAQMTYAELANHREPHLHCLESVAACIVPDQCQQAPAGGTSEHELALQKRTS